MKERWEMINEINVLYNEISRLQCLLDNTLVKISEDCISRKQAIEEMSEALIVLCYDYNMEQDELVETIEEQVRACAQQILKSLPSVAPTERKER